MKDKENSQKIKRAVALSYQSEHDSAPKMTAKGMNELAQKIIDTAIRNNVPIQKDQTLVSLLSVLELGDTIPPELYQAVAEIFNFIYQMDRATSINK